MTARRRRGADTQRHAAPIVIVVTGQPQAQGSKTRTRYGAMREANENLRPWRDAVTWHARQQAAPNSGVPHPITGPIRLSAAFSFRRPKAHYRTGRNAHLLRDGAPPYPTGKPDLSKLVRAVEDALTDAGIWRDDAQVVDLTGCRKLWCGEHPDALDEPGVSIQVQPAHGQLIGYRVWNGETWRAYSPVDVEIAYETLRAAGYGDPPRDED